MATNRLILTCSDVMADRLTQLYQEPVNTIFLTTMLRLIEGLTDIDGAARKVGLSLQQLQRILRREGTSYRELLDRAKLMKAR